ncbi:hypothetical protein BXZ70DRAFT_1004696 [Cristinia sonorae]|uniref:Uncharacterized protein n=1 Tax=Cristinia sonorae TaxID=1940300 RepID=A0A8K0UUZ8_9AGAR|nr:hypothetical protein BXZ70DRAFT_1004696 [Cristinia sonorae]
MVTPHVRGQSRVFPGVTRTSVYKVPGPLLQNHKTQNLTSLHFHTYFFINMGAIVSAIGGAIQAVISAIASVCMIIVSTIVTIIVTIFDIIFDILCCNCFGGRKRRTGIRSPSLLFVLSFHHPFTTFTYPIYDTMDIF